jgi:manganese-dependent ADP-ribose/CDP-alcohol diphosphatase
MLQGCISSPLLRTLSRTLSRTTLPPTLTIPTKNRSRLAGFTSIGKDTVNMKSTTIPLFSFGVVSDIQYANRPLERGRERYELDALYKLNNCITTWKNYHLPLKCAVSLGDIIDGHEGETAHHKDAEDLRDVLAAFGEIDVPTYHVLGNHCVWNLGCHYLSRELGLTNRYYDIEMHKGWRFVILDGTDLSVMKESHSHSEAKEYIQTNAHRMLEDWNGGISKKQQKWFSDIVSAAKLKKEKLIVFCHWPLLNCWGAEMEASLMWNADDLLPLLDPEAVFMFMSGHIHENGYVNHNGVHHITLSAIVSAPLGDTAHAIVHVHDDKVVIEGFGTASPLSGELSCDMGGADTCTISLASSTSTVGR